MTTTTTTNNATDELLAKIAGHFFPTCETLETRHCDSLDFHEAPVWAIKDALAQAFEFGRQTATGSPAPTVGNAEAWRRYLLGAPAIADALDHPAAAIDPPPSHFLLAAERELADEQRPADLNEAPATLAAPATICEAVLDCLRISGIFPPVAGISKYSAAPVRIGSPAIDPKIQELSLEALRRARVQVGDPWPPPARPSWEWDDVDIAQIRLFVALIEAAILKATSPRHDGPSYESAPIVVVEALRRATEYLRETT